MIMPSISSPSMRAHGAGAGASSPYGIGGSYGAGAASGMYAVASPSYGTTIGQAKPPVGVAGATGAKGADKYDITKGVGGLGDAQNSESDSD